MLKNIFNTIVPRDIFCDSSAFTVINKYGKGGVIQTLTAFGRPYMLLSEGSYEGVHFRDLINHVFWSP